MQKANRFSDTRLYKRRGGKRKIRMNISEIKYVLRKATTAKYANA